MIGGGNGGTNSTVGNIGLTATAGASAPRSKYFVYLKKGQVVPVTIGAGGNNQTNIAGGITKFGDLPSNGSYYERYPQNSITGRTNGMNSSICTASAMGPGGGMASSSSASANNGTYFGGGGAAFIGIEWGVNNNQPVVNFTGKGANGAIIVEYYNPYISVD